MVQSFTWITVNITVSKDIILTDAVLS